jgi:hypothetical protein
VADQDGFPELAIVQAGLQGGLKAKSFIIVVPECRILCGNSADSRQESEPEFTGRRRLDARIVYPRDWRWYRRVQLPKDRPSPSLHCCARVDHDKTRNASTVTACDNKLPDALSRDDESSGEKNCIRLCNNCNVWDEPEMNDHFISSEYAGASNLMPVG